jgi:hypothetical protein
MTTSDGRGKLGVRMEAVAPGDVRPVTAQPRRGARIERRKFVPAAGAEALDQVLVYDEDDGLLFVGSEAQLATMRRVLSLSAEG